ncbi:MAG: S-layer homology domain-containing protein [Clostridiaceae bacterium]
MKKLKMKVNIILTVVLMIMCIPANASAFFSDVPEAAPYADALDRLSSLGIIAVQENFNPDDLLTREQFAKIIVVAAGLENTANSMKGSTIFPDIAQDAWSSGYINVAVREGYITGWTDGKFHPSQPITYAQICTILVKALGYSDQDIQGTWPNNYIAKAKELGLSDGLTLGNNDSITRSIAITMVDRLLNTNIKNGSGGTGQAFIDTTGNFTKCIIFGDSTTIPYLQAGQVLTDKGTFNCQPNVKLQLGSENYIIIKNSTIQKAYAQSSVLKVSVEQSTENRISYQSGDDLQSMLLPDNITYYYQGLKTDYKNLQSILQKSASIVFSYNSDKTGYSYAIVFDPVYSKPEIADSFTESSGKIGSITFEANPIIVRNGEIAGISLIEAKDVVYQITDIWGDNKYYLIVDNKISGEVAEITPNSLSPKTLKIDSVNYDLSKDIDLSKVAATYGDFAVGNHITAYLGYDGKIVDVESFGTQDQSNYAVVLGASTTIAATPSGTNTIRYSVKLLSGTGVTATYQVESNVSGLKGALVKYTFTDSDTISLEQVPYSISSSETTINKDGRKIDSYYVADNVKIIDLVFTDSGSEIQANMLRWSDLPTGTVPAGKIWSIKTSGAFNDVSLIVTDDILNQRSKLGIVSSALTKGNSYEYTVLIDGREYKWNTNTTIPTGSVVKFKMTASGIDSITQIMYTTITSSGIQAIDGRRIKLNGTVYYFNNNFSIYSRDSSGNITVKNPSDIDTAKTYQKVSLYTYDITNYDNKVSMLLLDE